VSGAPPATAEGAGTVGSDPATAQEILRQAQTLIQAQIDASKVIDAKLMSILQACLSLMVASLGGAAFAFAPNSWLPVWSGAGLATTGSLFGIGAALAFWSLRVGPLGAPAIRPMALMDRDVHKLPAQQGYLAIAFELNRVIELNDRLARHAAARAARPFYFALAAPVLGAAAAAITAYGDARSALIAVATLIGPIVVLRLAASLFGVGRP
jgi:hypothetical protein